MLAANHRMRRGADFSAALRGRRAGSRRLAVALGPAIGNAIGNATGDAASGDVTAAPIVGFVVSKAVGGATTRNLVRRRLRHAVAPRLTELGPGSRLVIRALPAAASASYDDLVRDLDSALARVIRSAGAAGSSS